MMAVQSRLTRRVRSLLKIAISYPKQLLSKSSASAVIIDSAVDSTAALDARVRFYRSALGRYSYIGRGSFVESAQIGAFCSIAGRCFIGGASHPMDGASTSPVFHEGGQYPQKELRHPFFRAVREDDHRQ